MCIFFEVLASLDLAPVTQYNLPSSINITSPSSGHSLTFMRTQAPIQEFGSPSYIPKTLQDPTRSSKILQDPSRPFKTIQNPS